MTVALLNDIIVKLYNIRYNVVAVVNDMGPSNIGLWRNLKISVEKTSFLHPITSQNIYVFADVPHLIKLARNHFLDKLIFCNEICFFKLIIMGFYRGFVLPDGKYIGVNVIKELFKVNGNNDYKLAYKLSERHIMVGASRMNVKLAVQLFSNSVAKALSFCGNKNIIIDYNWKEVQIN